MNNTLRKTFIAIEAVLYIACNSGITPVRSKEICKYQGVTVRYLEHIMQRLVRAGVLKGMRGPKGGYLLAKDKRNIKLSDIYEVVRSMESAEEDDSEQSMLYRKIINPVILNVENNISGSMSQTTIQDLCEHAQKQNLPENLKKKTDFII